MDMVEYGNASMQVCVTSRSRGLDYALRTVESRSANLTVDARSTPSAGECVANMEEEGNVSLKAKRAAVRSMRC